MLADLQQWTTARRGEHDVVEDVEGPVGPLRGIRVHDRSSGVDRVPTVARRPTVPGSPGSGRQETEPPRLTTSTGGPVSIRRAGGRTCRRPPAPARCPPRGRQVGLGGRSMRPCGPRVRRHRSANRCASAGTSAWSVCQVPTPAGRRRGDRDRGARFGRGEGHHVISPRSPRNAVARAISFSSGALTAFGHPLPGEGNSEQETALLNGPGWLRRQEGRQADALARSKAPG